MWGKAKYRKCKSCGKHWFPTQHNKGRCPHCHAKVESKYKNKKVERAGHWFDSRGEAALFDRLSLEERAGRIRDLKSQPGTVFLSEARVQYRPDFSFFEGEERVWAEFKGFPTQAWNIKKRLWKEYGPGKLYIWGGTISSLRLMETLIPRSKP